MNWPNVLDSFTATSAPLLPSLDLQRWGMSVSWGLVLAAIWLMASSRARAATWLQRSGAGLLMLACLVTGAYSPAYWLGLAFQSPSLTSSLLALGLVVRKLKRGSHSPKYGIDAAILIWPIVLGLILGWLLLLDTFALLPWSVFATGFSPTVLGGVLLLLLLPWMIAGQRAKTGPYLMALLIWALMYLVFRLPNGNFWSALLDPWLWMGLHVWLARSLVHRFKSRAALNP